MWKSSMSSAGWSQELLKPQAEQTHFPINSGIGVKSGIIHK